MATIFETQLTTRDEWIQACFSKNGSLNAPNMAKTALKHWDAFLNAKYPEIKEYQIIQDLKAKQDQPELAIFLNKFVQFMATVQNLSPKSTRDYFGFIKSWLRANAVRINNDDVKQFVHQPKLIKEAKHPITTEEIRMLYDQSSKTFKALLVTLMSSGMRLGECLQLRLGDVDLETGIIRLRADTTKTKEERDSFISKEACRHIETITKKKKKTDLIFVHEYTKHTRINLETRFASIRKNAGLEGKYDLTNRHKINMHGLRAFFHTQATKIIGGDIAHAMIGHHGYLDQYLRVSTDEKKEMYKKIEPYVSLSQEFTLMKKLENTEQKLRGEKYYDEKAAKMEQQIEMLEDSNKKLLETLKSIQG